LKETGFLFAPAGVRFNDNIAFQTFESQQTRWGGLFSLEWSKPFGLADYLDISVWRKRAVGANAAS
jgi:hypothetical protein